MIPEDERRPLDDAGTAKLPLEPVAADAPASARLVKQFRQILVWPLQLMPAVEGAQIH